MKIDETTGRLSYQSSEGILDVSDYLTLVHGLQDLVEQYFGVVDDRLGDMIHTLITQVVSPMAEWLKGATVFVITDTDQLDTVVNDLKASVQQVMGIVNRQTPCFIELDANTSFYCYLLPSREFSTIEMCVTFTFLGRSIVLRYDGDGLLLNTPGQMNMFYSVEYPMSANPERLLVTRQTDQVGPRSVERLAIQDPAVRIDDLGECLNDACWDAFWFSGQLLRYENIKPVVLSTEAQAWVDQIVAKNGSPEQLGFCTQTNQVCLPLSKDSKQAITLDCLPGFELKVLMSRGAEDLFVPTHSLWQEIKKLNRLSELTRAVTYAVSSQRDSGYYNVLVYVCDPRDQEWKFYTSMVFDSCGQRQCTFKENMAANKGKLQILDLGCHPLLAAELAFYDLNHAQIMAHKNLEDAAVRRAVAIEAKTKTALVSQLFERLNDDDSPLFRNIRNHRLLEWKEGDAYFDMEFLSFYVCSESLTWANAYLEDGVPEEQRDEFRSALLGYFSFSPFSEIPSTCRCERCCEKIKQLARKKILALAERVHTRAQMERLAFGQLVTGDETPFTILLQFDAGKPIKSQGSPPRKGEFHKKHYDHREDGLVL